MKKNNLTSFLLVLILGFVTAKISYGNDLNKINDNKIDNDSDLNELDNYCEMKPFPAKPETMCCGVDVTSSNRIVGGEPTALNQYPWMAIVEYQYINRKVRGLRCGGSLISSRYVLTAAHCVAGKILEDSIPVTVVLGDYDKFHYGPDCVISNGRKICTQGELRIPIKTIKVHPGYDTMTSSNDIALIQMSKMAPYTDAIRPICLPSGDLTKHFQENLWLDIAGWGTMKQEKVGDIFKSNTSSLKRHLRVPFVPTKKCQTIWFQVNSKQMCAGGLSGKDACTGDSGGPLMFNNRGQFEVSGVVSYGHAKPCGRKGVPTVYTNVHEYIPWIFNQIEIMERLINTKFTRFTPKYVPQTPLTVTIGSKGNGLKTLVEPTTTKTQNSSIKENIEETKPKQTQVNTSERNVKESTMTPSQQSTSKGKPEEATVVVVPRPHISPNWNIRRRSEETIPPHYTTSSENIFNRFQYTTPRHTNIRSFRNYDPLHLRSIHPQMWVHNLHPSRDYQFGSIWQRTF